MRNASMKGNLPVKYLIENGSDIHAENDEALEITSEYGYFDIVKYLVENSTTNNHNALRLSMLNGHIRIIDYLIERVIL